VDKKVAKQILDKIVGQVFGYKNPFTVDEFIKKFAYDVRIPVEVNDCTTGEVTWTQIPKSGKYITDASSAKLHDQGVFDPPKQLIENMEQLLSIWEKTNYMGSSRTYDSINVAESDAIVQSENIYKCMDIRLSKNVLFSDGLGHSEYVAASQRNGSIQYCIRAEDCKTCSNCYNIVWCVKCVNCMHLIDCLDMYECLFCSHMESKKFCVANIQFSEEEYKKIKDMVVRWILTK
jgi:hypothetical protein